jgi:hypothetical protein
MEAGADTAVESFCIRPGPRKDSLASDDDEEDERRQQRPRNRLGGTEKTTETSVTIVGVPAKCRTGHLRNKSQKATAPASLLGFAVVPLKKIS